MEKETKGFLATIGGKYVQLWEWVKPEQGDHLLLKVIKTLAKGTLALILVLISPVVIVILAIVFFAAI